MRKTSQEPRCSQDETPCNINASFDWNSIDAFIRTVKAPQAPSNLDPERKARGQTAFAARRCNACHNGPGWTVSRAFYQPGTAANGQVPFADPRPGALPEASQLSAMLGSLRTSKYRFPVAPPPAFLPVPSAPEVLEGPFRAAPAGDATPAVIAGYVFGAASTTGCGVGGAEACPAPPPDQISCALRAVGTFPSPPSPTFEGRVASVAGAPPVREVRHILNATTDVYEDKAALGATGYNVPSLLGVAAGAPYFHAGNARTLEEVFDVSFAAHYGVFDSPVGSVPLSSGEIQDLVTYLLSIDDITAQQAPPTDLGFDPDLCAQFKP